MMRSKCMLSTVLLILAASATVQFPAKSTEVTISCHKPNSEKQMNTS